MEFDPRSAHYLTRDDRPCGVQPPLRSKRTPSVVAVNRRITRKLGRSRRKRSTENALLTAQAPVGFQENESALHQRSDSTTAIDAGAAKKTSKVQLFYTSSPKTSTFCKTQNTKRYKSRSRKAATKGDSPSLPKTPPPIPNVAHVDVAPNTATYTNPYLYIYELDDLSRWDMDSIPSIPSPPTSPGNNSAVSSSHSTYFSIPIEDNEPLENEIPFPLNRHPKVFENMGIKKSKNKARANAETGLTRLVTLPRKSLPASLNQPQEQSTLPGLPYPLPLRNTETTPSLSTAPALAEPQSSPSPQPKSGPSASKKDAWGCMHLGAADCELSIVFPSTPHYEVWDMGDDTNIACPVLLCLMAKDAYAWSGMPLALPDVTRIEVQCEDLLFPSPMSVYGPNNEYNTHYTGSKTGTTKDDLDTTVETKLARDGISIEGKWTRTYSKPGVEGSGRARVDQRGPVISGHNIRARCQNYDAAAMAMGGAYARGWYLKAWIPIPTRLFLKRETRIFNINAQIFMMGDEERVLSLDGKEASMIYPLLADAHMTVSHLRSRKEMDGCWW